MTWFVGIMSDNRQCVVRLAWMWWAAAMSVLCAGFLWYSAYVAELHVSELHKIINYSADAVVVCGPRGELLYANDALTTITGFSEQDLKEGGVELMIPDVLRAPHRAGLARAELKIERGVEGINYRTIYPVLHKNGDRVICRVSVGTIRHFGKPQFFAFITPVALPGENEEKPTQLPQQRPEKRWTATLEGELPR